MEDIEDRTLWTMVIPWCGTGNPRVPMDKLQLSLARSQLGNPQNQGRTNQLWFLCFKYWLNPLGCVPISKFWSSWWLDSKFYLLTPHFISCFSILAGWETPFFPPWKLHIFSWSKPQSPPIWPGGFVVGNVSTWASETQPVEICQQLEGSSFSSWLTHVDFLWKGGLSKTKMSNRHGAWTNWTNSSV